MFDSANIIGSVVGAVVNIQSRRTKQRRLRRGRHLFALIDMQSGGRLAVLTLTFIVMISPITKQIFIRNK